MRCGCTNERHLWQIGDGLWVVECGTCKATWLSGREIVEGWMCSTAWGWEAGETDVRVWPSRKSLKRNCSCIGKPTKDKRGRVLHECKPVRIAMYEVGP